MRETVLFVQHGDYREAFRRLGEGGEETYLDQKRSVDFVSDLAECFEVVVAAPSVEAYDQVLRPRLRAIGIPRDRFYKADSAKELLSACTPTHVIPRTALEGLLRAVRSSAVPCFPLFADIFQPVLTGNMLTKAGLSTWLHHRRLASLLGGKSIVAVGNHGLNASRTLHDALSVSTNRIVPWEWTPLVADPEPKSLKPGVTRVFFAGAISEDKGASDLVGAAKLLAGSVDKRVEFAIAGAGPALPSLKSLVEETQLEDRVRFLGLIPRDEVVARMLESDLVVVPSRPRYPEGMPNVIFEALAARTPIVLSDHPSFRGRFIDGEGAVFFRSGDIVSLADAIQRVLVNPALYCRLSSNTEATLRGLYVGASWYMLIDRFLHDPDNRTGWVQKHSLERFVSTQDDAKENEGARVDALPH